MNNETPAFVYRHQVQFVDTDMAGIVHFSNFFRYMEAAEDAFLRHLDIDLVSTIDGKHVSLPRLSATCQYSSPLRFPDKVDVAVRVKEMSRKTIRYSFVMSVDDRQVADGEVLAVCCEVGEKLQSIPLPEGMRAKLEAYLAGKS